MPSRWIKQLLASTAPVALFAPAFGFALSTFVPPTAAQSSGAAPVELPPISVEDNRSSGYQPDQSALPKLTQPLLDTPQSVDTVPRQLLDDQGVATMRDALRNVAGISLAAGESSQQGDNLTLRGFSARSDIYLDGMRDFGSYYRDPFYLENIEVLKGPSSILFGRGSTGGVIEQNSKNPRLDAFTTSTFAFGTDMTKRVTTDVNRAVPALGSGAAFRINLMAHDSDVAGRDVAENSRIGIAPTLALGLGTSTRATLSFLHQTEYDIPDYGLPWLNQGSPGTARAVAEPAPVAGHNFYGFSHGDYLRTNVDVATAKIEHDLNDAVTLRDQLRYANYKRSYRITEPQIDVVGTNTPLLVQPGTPLGSLTVTRNQLSGNSLETFAANQSDVTAKFKTLTLSHTLVAGIELTRETSDPNRYTTAFGPGISSTTSLVAPDSGQPFNAQVFPSSIAKTSAYGEAVYALDTVKIDEQWEVLGGWRYDRFDADFTQTNFAQNGANTGTIKFSPVDYMPSWRAAIVYKPAPNGSLYFDYGTSFDPSAEQLSLSAANGALAPVKNRTYEVGSKWDVFHESLSLRGAIFRTEQTNVRETDPNNSQLQILAGNARVDGIEFEVAGHLTEAWQIYAGYAYMFSEITSSPQNDVGNRLANVPMHTANLWTTYRLPWDIEVGGGVNYVSSRYASSTPTAVGGVNFLRKAPGYATLDAMAKYEVNEHIALQLNVYNIADTFYYDGIHPSHVIPGAGRTALFTVTTRF